MEIPVEASQALAVLRQVLGNSLVAAYLHGSAVAGGLRPKSDVDLLAVTDRPIAPAVRTQLLAALMTISGRPGSATRPLEVIVFHLADLQPPGFPARCEFLYGEWLREACEAGDVPEPHADPEYTLLLAQAAKDAIPLVGPPAADLLPAIPEADIRRAIGNALPALLGTLEGDERNVLLTLARMWHTLTDGNFVPKDVAAAGIAQGMPADLSAVLDCARLEYLGTHAVDWQACRQQTQQAAEHLGERVSALLQITVPGA